jgi:tRNA-binding protein
MNIFYNEKMGDVLFITVKQADGPFEYNKQDDVVTITQDGEVVGYNVFNINDQLNLESTGLVQLDADKVEAVNSVLSSKGIAPLEVDLSPKFVVGHIDSMEKHPDADKLNICQVNVGDAVLQIVCGAKNVAAGQNVVVAKVGAVMPSGMLIKDAELRGVASSGMICSERELGLTDSEEKKGILVLDEQAVPGTDFFKQD